MKNRFTTEELEQLKEAAKLLERYKYSDIFGDISAHLQKLIDIIEIGISKEPGENYDFIHPEKVPHFKGSEYLTPIIKAIKNEKTLRIYYQPFYEDKPYFIEVHPYLLKEHKSRWYMIGFNDFKQQLRTYSLDRIHDVQDSDIKYIKQDFDASSYFKNSIGVISPGGEVPRIRIAVQKTQAQYMITQPWHDSQNIEEENEDEIIFSFRVYPTYEFISLLLSYGKDLKVISPESVKEQVKSHLVSLTQYYSQAAS